MFHQQLLGQGPGSAKSGLQIGAWGSAPSPWLRSFGGFFGHVRVLQKTPSVFAEGECDEKDNVQILHVNRRSRPVAFYSLDVIISVGYRVKSPQGTRFRRWAPRF
ncbi:MAG: virulence RhuM family protein [Fibrobacterales bacterium]|nr:virulence RhuM family protein [Fibrobacterales bacterium]